MKVGVEYTVYLSTSSKVSGSGNIEWTKFLLLKMENAADGHLLGFLRRK